MTELPYMALWINDYLNDTQALTIEQSGCYLHLLMHMWSAGGSLPNSPQKLAWICRVSVRRWNAVIAPALDQYFVKVELSDGDVIQNRRLSLELDKARVNRAQKRGAANARWLKNNKKNGAAAYAAHSSSKVEGYQDSEYGKGGGERWKR